MPLGKPLRRPLAARSAVDPSADEDLANMTEAELTDHGRRGLANLKVQISAPADTNIEHEAQGD